MYQVSAQRLFPEIGKFVEPAPTPHHTLAFFRINQLHQVPRSFPYYYSHVSKVSIDSVRSGRFIEELALQDAPKVYAIQSFWKPAIRGSHIKCRWGKIILIFSYEKLSSGIMITIRKLKPQYQP